jgi:RND family efflux transporter MFP subunit
MPSHSSSFRFLALAAGLAACAPEPTLPGARAASESAPVEVRTTLVALASFERSVPALGELAPYERVVLATKVPGRLAELRVDRGDEVVRGAVLAALEAREYELRVRAAEAAVTSARALLGLAAAPGDGPEADAVALDAVALDVVDPEATAAVRLARAELERARLERERTAALAREGVDSQALADRAEADYRAAESRLQEAFELVAARRAALAQRRAELEIARAQLAETRIEAPFDGAVVARLTATGAYLAIGAPVLELVRLDAPRLVLEVGERDAVRVRVGQSVRARLAGTEGELAGRVTRLAPALARDGRALVVEAELDGLDLFGGALRPGAFAEVRLVVEPAAQALALPIEAVVSFAGLDKAFVVRGERVEERRLSLGQRAGEHVEVLSGLAAGDEVVLAPGKLTTGARVRVVN